MLEDWQQQEQEMLLAVVISTNRLIPDLIKAIINKHTLQIRNPNATRPWQHVFDVIYGYLLLMNIYENFKFSTAYNLVQLLVLPKC